MKFVDKEESINILRFVELILLGMNPRFLGILDAMALQKEGS